MERNITELTDEYNDYEPMTRNVSFESRFHRVEHERKRNERGHRRSIPPLSNALGDVLIQVQQRGCCGVCSGRRYPQRKSSIFVVVLLDSGSRTVSIRGHGRRCESVRFEKVRTIELLSSYHPPPPLNPFRSLHSSLLSNELLLLHILFVCSCFSIFIYIYIRIMLLLIVVVVVTVVALTLLGYYTIVSK